MQVDYLGEPTAGNLQLTHRAQHDSVMQLLGLADINDVFHAPIPQVRGQLCFANISPPSSSTRVLDRL